MQKMTAGGREIAIYRNKEGGPLICWMMQEHREGSAELTFEKLREMAGEQPFVLAAISCEDWNRDFSPWQSGNFAGEGRTMLDKVMKILPDLEKAFSCKRRYIAGYSLAGLFALWAFYETGLFAGAASGSGSLWYPGWMEYLSGRRSPYEHARIYLSLGGKEEKSKDPLMARVGENTRQTAALLKKDPNIAESCLVFHAGGHFSNPEGRIAKGMYWLLQGEVKDA